MNTPPGRRSRPAANGPALMSFGGRAETITSQAGGDPQRTTPIVRAVVTIDFTKALDPFGILDAGRAAVLLPVVSDHFIDLQLGAAHGVVGHLGEVIRQLRGARGITVRGDHPATVREVELALQTGLRRARPEVVR